MHPRTHSKRACSMIFPRSAVELSSPGSPRSPFWQMNAVFTSHCCRLPVLCHLLKVSKQPWKCASQPSASWDAAHVARGTAWVWNCSSPPWTLPENRSALQTRALQPWPVFMDSSFVAHTCFSLPYTAPGCSHKIPAKTRESSQSTSLHCSCVWETLSLMNCQP